MAGEKAYVFDIADLYQLLVHYSDGELPLAGEVREVLLNEYLPRMIGLLVESDEWTQSDPLQLRYQGKRTASWAKTSGNDHMIWEERAETPRPQ